MNSAFSYLGEVEPDKGNLIKGLQLIQTREGYVSNDGILAAAEHFGIPAAEVEGVLTFYAQFKRTKPGKYKLSVCCSLAPVLSINGRVYGKLDRKSLTKILNEYKAKG